MPNTNDLLENIHSCLLSSQSETFISATYLASCVMKKIDPDSIAPELVSWGCVLELRQLSRQVLRKEYEPKNEDNGQIEIFEKLQERYPVKRHIGIGDEKSIESGYISRMDMTREERREAAEKFRRISNAYAEHADALNQETDALEAQGAFSGIA